MAKTFTNAREAQHLNMDDVLDIMREKSAGEIAEFKEFASSVKEDGKPRTFVEIRQWVLNKYYGDMFHQAKDKKNEMLDKIMSL